MHVGQGSPVGGHLLLLAPFGHALPLFAVVGPWGRKGRAVLLPSAGPRGAGEGASRAGGSMTAKTKGGGGAGSATPGRQQYGLNMGGLQCPHHRGGGDYNRS